MIRQQLNEARRNGKSRRVPENLQQLVELKRRLSSSDYRWTQNSSAIMEKQVKLLAINEKSSNRSQLNTGKFRIIVNTYLIYLLFISSILELRFGLIRATSNINSVWLFGDEQEKGANINNAYNHDRGIKLAPTIELGDNTSRNHEQNQLLEHRSGEWRSRASISGSQFQASASSLQPSIISREQRDDSFALNEFGGAANANQSDHQRSNYQPITIVANHSASEETTFGADFNSFPDNHSFNLLNQTNSQVQFDEEQQQQSMLHNNSNSNSNNLNRHDQVEVKSTPAPKYADLPSGPVIKLTSGQHESFPPDLMDIMLVDSESSNQQNNSNSQPSTDWSSPSSFSHNSSSPHNSSSNYEPSRFREHNSDLNWNSLSRRNDSNLYRDPYQSGPFIYHVPADSDRNGLGWNGNDYYLGGQQVIGKANGARRKLDNSGTEHDLRDSKQVVNVATPRSTLAYANTLSAFETDPDQLITGAYTKTIPSTNSEDFYDSTRHQRAALEPPLPSTFLPASEDNGILVDNQVDNRWSAIQETSNSERTTNGQPLSYGFVPHLQGSRLGRPTTTTTSTTMSAPPTTTTTSRPTLPTFDYSSAASTLAHPFEGWPLYLSTTHRPGGPLIHQPYPLRNSFSKTLPSRLINQRPLPSTVNSLHRVEPQIVLHPAKIFSQPLRGHRLAGFNNVIGGKMRVSPQREATHAFAPLTSHRSSPASFHLMSPTLPGYTYKQRPSGGHRPTKKPLFGALGSKLNNWVAAPASAHSFSDLSNSISGQLASASLEQAFYDEPGSSGSAVRVGQYRAKQPIMPNWPTSLVSQNYPTLNSNADGFAYYPTFYDQARLVPVVQPTVAPPMGLISGRHHLTRQMLPVRVSGNQRQLGVSPSTSFIPIVAVSMTRTSPAPKMIEESLDAHERPAHDSSADTSSMAIDDYLEHKLARASQSSYARSNNGSLVGGGQQKDNQLWDDYGGAPSASMMARNSNAKARLRSQLRDAQTTTIKGAVFGYLPHQAESPLIQAFNMIQQPQAQQLHQQHPTSQFDAAISRAYPQALANPMVSNHIASASDSSNANQMAIDTQSQMANDDNLLPLEEQPNLALQIQANSLVQNEIAHPFVSQAGILRGIDQVYSAGQHQMHGFQLMPPGEHNLNQLNSAGYPLHLMMNPLLGGNVGATNQQNHHQLLAATPSEPNPWLAQQSYAISKQQQQQAFSASAQTPAELGGEANEVDSAMDPVDVSESSLGTDSKANKVGRKRSSEFFANAGQLLLSALPLLLAPTLGLLFAASPNSAARYHGVNPFADSASSSSSSSSNQFSSSADSTGKVSNASPAPQMFTPTPPDYTHVLVPSTTSRPTSASNQRTRTPTTSNPSTSLAPNNFGINNLHETSKSRPHKNTTNPPKKTILILTTLSPQLQITDGEGANSSLLGHLLPDQLPTNYTTFEELANDNATTTTAATTTLLLLAGDENDADLAQSNNSLAGKRNHYDIGYEGADFDAQFATLKRADLQNNHTNQADAISTATTIGYSEGDGRRTPTRNRYHYSPVSESIANRTYVGQLNRTSSNTARNEEDDDRLFPVSTWPPMRLKTVSLVTSSGNKTLLDASDKYATNNELRQHRKPVNHPAVAVAYKRSTPGWRNATTSTTTTWFDDEDEEYEEEGKFVGQRQPNGRVRSNSSSLTLVTAPQTRIQLDKLDSKAIRVKRQVSSEQQSRETTRRKTVTRKSNQPNRIKIVVKKMLTRKAINNSTDSSLELSQAASNSSLALESPPQTVFELDLQNSTNNGRKSNQLSSIESSATSQPLNRGDDFRPTRRLGTNLRENLQEPLRGDATRSKTAHIITTTIAQVDNQSNGETTNEDIKDTTDEYSGGSREELASAETPIRSRDRLLRKKLMLDRVATSNSYFPNHRMLAPQLIDDDNNDDGQLQDSDSEREERRRRRSESSLVYGGDDEGSLNLGAGSRGRFPPAAVSSSPATAPIEVTATKIRLLPNESLEQKTASGLSNGSNKKTLVLTEDTKRALANFGSLLIKDTLQIPHPMENASRPSKYKLKSAAQRRHSANQGDDHGRYSPSRFSDQSRLGSYAPVQSRNDGYRYSARPTVRGGDSYYDRYEMNEGSATERSFTQTTPIPEAADYPPPRSFPLRFQPNRYNDSHQPNETEYLPGLRSSSSPSAPFRRDQPFLPDAVANLVENELPAYTSRSADDRPSRSAQMDSYSQQQSYNTANHPYLPSQHHQQQPYYHRFEEPTRQSGGGEHDSGYQVGEQNPTGNQRYDSGGSGNLLPPTDNGAYHEPRYSSYSGYSGPKLAPEPQTTTNYSDRHSGNEISPYNQFGRQYYYSEPNRYHNSSSASNINRNTPSYGPEFGGKNNLPSYKHHQHDNRQQPNSDFAQPSIYHQHANHVPITAPNQRPTDYHQSSQVTNYQAGYGQYPNYQHQTHHNSIHPAQQHDDELFRNHQMTGPPPPSAFTINGHNYGQGGKYSPSVHSNEARQPPGLSPDPSPALPGLRMANYHQPPSAPSSLHQQYPDPYLLPSSAPASALLQQGGPLAVVSSSAGVGNQDRSDQSRTVSEYLKRVQFSDSDRDKLMASYLTCDGLLNDNDHCLERLSCEFSDPQNIEKANKLDRAVSSILLGHILINTYIPNQFKLRLKSASLFGYTQSGKCSRFACNKLNKASQSTGSS